MKKLCYIDKENNFTFDDQDLLEKIKETVTEAVTDFEKAKDEIDDLKGNEIGAFVFLRLIELGYREYHNQMVGDTPQVRH